MKKIVSVLLTITMVISLCGCSVIDLSGKKKYVEATRTLLNSIINTEKDLYYCKDLLLNVWYNSIRQINDPKTDKYTKENGEFFDNFNIALEKLYSDEDFISKINKLNETQSELRKAKIVLEDPPSGAANFSQILIDLTNTYIEYCCTVIDANGSYKEVHNKLRELDSLLKEQARELEPYLEEINEFIN